MSTVFPKHFFWDFVVVINVKHRIAEIMKDTVFDTHGTQPLPAPSVAFPTKQDLDDSLSFFAER